MRFFLPHTDKSGSEPAYQEMRRLLADQLRWQIADRRIFRISYFNNKRTWSAEVGRPRQQEQQYNVVAIFESTFFIVVNQTALGGPGPIVMVDKSEVTATEDFQA